METYESESSSFDENQSFQVVKEMIQVSQKKLKNDGILFILFALPDQLLFEAIAWLIAFVIPGHILYSKRNG